MKGGKKRRGWDRRMSRLFDLYFWFFYLFILVILVILLFYYFIFSLLEIIIIIIISLEGTRYIVLTSPIYTNRPIRGRANVTAYIDLFPLIFPQSFPDFLLFHQILLYKYCLNSPSRNSVPYQKTV